MIRMVIMIADIYWPLARSQIFFQEYLLNYHSNPMRSVLLFPSFLEIRKLRHKNLNNLPKASQIISGGRI